MQTILPLGTIGVHPLISEVPIPPGGRMFCTVEALVLCGILALLSMKHQLRQVAGWSAQ